MCALKCSLCDVFNVCVSVVCGVVCVMFFDVFVCSVWCSVCDVFDVCVCVV